MISPCIECGAPGTTDWHVIPPALGGHATVPLCKSHAQAAADVRLLSIRTGQERARAEGVHIGRPRALPDATLARLRALRREGLSQRAIARQMNAEGLRGAHGGRWHESSVRAALRRYGA